MEFRYESAFGNSPAKKSLRFASRILMGHGVRGVSFQDGRACNSSDILAFRGDCAVVDVKSLQVVHNLRNANCGLAFVYVLPSWARSIKGIYLKVSGIYSNRGFFGLWQYCYGSRGCMNPAGFFCGGNSLHPVHSSLVAHMFKYGIAVNQKRTASYAPKLCF